MVHQNKNQNKNQKHLSVLLDETLNYLAPKEGDSYLDLTAGYGGHAAAVLEQTHDHKGAVLVDRDGNAAHELAKRFKETGVEIRHEDFLTASRQLVVENRQFDLILADLGVSSPHLNEAVRGFAISASGPLDMRMDQRQELTAETIINTYSEADLAELLVRYGEEPKARQIARAIVKARPLKNTAELAELIAKVWPGHSRVHPATRTFQALRIAVNDELTLLELSLPQWFQLLKPEGRLVVISFHSLEDRLVKRALSEASGQRYDAELKLLVKRPVTASQKEIVFNPRARSAKLRAAVKIKREREATDANSGKK